MYTTKKVSLKSYNTFGVDASCSEFYTIDEADEVIPVLEHLSFKPFVIGGGSNMLIVNDLELSVLKHNIQGIEILDEDEEGVFVQVGGGVNWHNFVLWSIDHGYGGLENLSLIPGSVGAAPIQNIGAYGVEQESAFVSLDAIDMRTGKHLVFEHAECAFGYRESVFKHELKGKLLITHVTYKLAKEPAVNTSYGTISTTLEQMGIEEPTIRDVSNAVIEIRSSKLPDPASLGNSGSFFKNPVVDADFFQGLLDRFENVVHYALPDGTFKIPAGWLIDQCGWRGKREGNVGCYEKQALVIVNYGGATGKEIWDFAQKVQANVLDKFGISLEPEVNILL